MIINLLQLMKAKIWFLLLSLCGILSACGNDGVTYVTTDSFLNKNSISDVRYLAVSDLQVGETRFCIMVPEKIWIGLPFLTSQADCF